MTNQQEQAVQNWLSSIFLEVPNPQEMTIPETGERVRMVPIRGHLFSSFLCRIGLPVVPTMEECRVRKWTEDMAMKVIAPDGTETQTRLVGIRADVLKTSPSKTDSQKPAADPKRGLRPSDDERREAVIKIVEQLGKDAKGYHASVKKIIATLTASGNGQRPQTTRRILRELKDQGQYNGVN